MFYQCFVYCGGKCGSSTITSTLINNGIETLLHVHNDFDFINNIIYKDIINQTNCKTVKGLIEIQNDKPIYVIDSFRDPIERLISSFFQNIETFLGNNYLNVDNKLINYCLYKSYKFEDYHPLDVEFPILKDIPFTDKYIKFEQNDVIYIKLRFKDINRWGEYLSEIFGREIVMFPENLSENKEYANKYKYFKESFRISQEMYDFFINHPLFLKYNNEKEIEDYKNYWSQRIESDEYFESLLDENLLVIPEDFNCEIYRLNVSEDYKTDFQLKFHYIFYGWREGYSYKLNEINISNDFMAQYGHDETWIDVTEIIKAFIINNKLEFRGLSYNDIFTDPIYGVVKILKIEDRENNVTYEFRENETLTINIT